MTTTETQLAPPKWEFQGNEITQFKGKYSFLSNFYRAPIMYKNVLYPTVENAYQASKTTSSVPRRQFEDCTPGKAKKLGQELRLRADWEEIKLVIMRDLVDQKFQDPYLARLLVATWPKRLIEGNTWGDTFWGVCEGVGWNHLGKILTDVRTLRRDQRQRW